MRSRGSYPKGEAKKQEILGLALDLVGETGYSSATLREIAERAGLTKNGLLHHFGTKEELFAAVLERWDEMARSRYSDASDVVDSVIDHVQLFTQKPGLMQLYARLSAEAIEVGHPAHRYFTERLRTVRQQFEMVFESMDAAGRLREGVDPKTSANLLIGTLEGLQVQWLYDPSLDMAAHVRRFFETIARDGDSTSATADRVGSEVG